MIRFIWPYKHGFAYTPTYETWKGMIARCGNNKLSKNYANYAGRGINVCKRWKKFEYFLSDMGERPQGMSLDRINNDKSYFPTNCRWADRLTQNNNKRKTKYLTFMGETDTLSNFARKYNLSYFALDKRLKRRWPLEQALGFHDNKTECRCGAIFSVAYDSCSIVNCPECGAAIKVGACA